MAETSYFITPIYSIMKSFRTFGSFVQILHIISKYLHFSACLNYVGALPINFLQPNFVHFLKLVKVYNSHTLIPTSPAQRFNYLLLEINAFVHPTPQLIVVFQS